MPVYVRAARSCDAGVGTVHGTNSERTAEVGRISRGGVQRNLYEDDGTRTRYQKAKVLRVKYSCDAARPGDGLRQSGKERIQAVVERTGSESVWRSVVAEGSLRSGAAKFTVEFLMRDACGDADGGGCVEGLDREITYRKKER